MRLFHHFLFLEVRPVPREEHIVIDDIWIQVDAAFAAFEGTAAV